MGYLQPGEYEGFGLSAETADEWIQMASSLIDGHCKRPSLMTTQYVERTRLVAETRTVRLSYLPIGSVTGVRVRYGRARRGELRGEFVRIGWGMWGLCSVFRARGAGWMLGRRIWTQVPGS